MTHILATFQTIIQQREKHANLPVPSPPNSLPFDFDGRNFLRSSSALTFSQRWKNANKAKGNFIEVKLLPASVHPSASWRIAKKPIGQLHCRGSCLSIFISLPASLRWANCRPPLQNGVWQGQFFMAKKEPVFFAVVGAQTLLLLIFVWSSWRTLLNYIHNTR